MIRALILLFGLAPLVGCAVDARSGRGLVEALAAGPIRDYAGAQADIVAATSLVLGEQLAPPGGGMADLLAAQQSWRKARAAYDCGVPVFVVVAPELDFLLDGHQDDPLAKSGLRELERALFGLPLAAPSELLRLSQSLSSAALALHSAVPSPSRPLAAASLVASLSAVAAGIANKLDGGLSPYAGASLLSAESNLRGLEAMYAPLSPVVAAADAGLDERLQRDLASLLSTLRDLPSLEAAPDKPLLLRQCAALSRDFADLATALGLTQSVINLS